MSRLQRFPGGLGAFGNSSGLLPTAAETTAYLARMSSQESAARQLLINNMIVGLKVNGFWDTADQIKLHLTTAQASGLNMKGATFDDVIVDAPVFAADAGYTTDGVNDAVDWGMAPSDGVQHTQNSAAVFCWFNQSGNYAVTPVGTATGATWLMTPRNAANLCAIRLNDGAATASSTTSNADAYGSVAMDRAASNAVKIYRQGLLLDAQISSTSAARSAVHIMSGQVNGVFGAGVTPIFRWVGASLSAAQHKALHELVADYFYAIGKLTIPIASQNITVNTTTTLPDGLTPPATAGKGYPCTGLHLDKSGDGTFWGGVGTAANEAAAGVVHLSADFTTILMQVSVATLGLPAGSTQGVTEDVSRGTIIFIHKGTIGVQCRFVEINKSTGALVRAVVLPATNFNGITLDTLRDRWVISKDDDTTAWYYRAGQSGTEFTRDTSLPIFTITNTDMAWYYAALDLVLITGGANGSAGFARWVSPRQQYRFQHFKPLSSDTEEGGVFDGTWFYDVSDGFTHSGATLLNQGRRYPMSTPLTM